MLKDIFNIPNHRGNEKIKMIMRYYLTPIRTAATQKRDKYWVSGGREKEKLN